MSRGYLTISVDDGHPADLRTAELLSRFGLRGTFYVPARNPKRPLLADGAIRDLAESFDVGGHTFNHRALRGLPADTAWSEIDEGRRWLEDVLGAATPSFCYPKGKFDAATSDLVKRAGYRGARTCRFNRSAFPQDAYAWGVSTHACSHPTHVQFRHALLEGNLAGMVDYVRVHRLAVDWTVHFMRAVEWVAQHGGVAHLYLHSWEIDENGDWSRLEEVFERAADRTELTPITNAELFSLTTGHPSEIDGAP